MTVRGVLVCHRATASGPHNAEVTYWADIAEARQAQQELTPCGPRCIGIHTTISVDVTPPPAPNSGRFPRRPPPTSTSTQGQ
ncbi:hypothetical protein A5784_32810 [Mycobacterium sp. 852013-50091_SCH5140682]|uniref:hypothetical protein n=1 Tax=Mycobacterium sp. 852013-50091_SCH5140682 TaxID=1834109 RepID=UPI0007E96E71|nr:hypothetical protein [Mycobacterium sp. 852013-50091_SCH5140682]OBC12612.1 hypothetical protein A5784_32810 [Mycobacterium sp. 852013-50091_SCH5140682]